MQFSEKLEIEWSLCSSMQIRIVGRRFTPRSGDPCSAPQAKPLLVGSNWDSITLQSFQCHLLSLIFALAQQLCNFFLQNYGLSKLQNIAGLNRWWCTCATWLCFGKHQQGFMTTRLPIAWLSEILHGHDALDAWTCLISEVITICRVTIVKGFGEQHSSASLTTLV